MSEESETTESVLLFAVITLVLCFVAYRLEHAKSSLLR
jgi:hypothetical protein